MQLRVHLVLLLLLMLAAQALAGTENPRPRRAARPLTTSVSGVSDYPKPVFSLYSDKIAPQVSPKKIVEASAETSRAKKKSRSVEKETKKLSKSSKSVKADKDSDVDDDSLKDKVSKKKSSKSAASDDDDEVVEVAAAAPPSPPLLSPSTTQFIILGAIGAFGVAVVGLLLWYLVSRTIASRTRRLRYMESLKPTYTKKGDGFDELREVIE